MASPNFHFDPPQTKDCKDPAQAIAWLQQSANVSVSACYAGVRIPQRINLGSTALLMMGTTAELQKVLRQDDANGIFQLETTGPGSMRIWYVRRKAGQWETKTVVLIASWPDYWGSRYDYPDRQRGWYDLWRGYFDIMSLRSLADDVLPKAKGVDAWW